MKGIAKTVVILAISGVCILLLSLTALSETGMPTGEHRTVLRRTGNTSHRPRVPLGQLIECEYIDSLLYVDCAVAEGISTMSITGEPGGTTYSYTFDSSALPISFDTPESDTLIIEIHTEWGNIYKGILELE